MVHSKKMDSNQWWELYDVRTEKFYYYNAQTGDTVWIKPEVGDIIPLSKLQVCVRACVRVCVSLHMCY